MSGKGERRTRQALVPELAVADIAASLAFYRELLGFETLYERPGEGFAYLRFGEAELMLDEIGRTRSFERPDAPWERPLGRGMNLQIAARDAAHVDRLHEACTEAGATVVLPLEDRTYRVGEGSVVARQFAVADPDGYVLRFAHGVRT